MEFALVVPLLMAMLLGIFTGGSAYFQKISLVDAARDAARYGASLKNDAASGGLATWKLNVQQRVVTLSGGQVTAGAVCVDLVTPTGSNTACGVNDPSGAASDPTVLTPASIVKVSVSKPAQLKFFFFTMTPNLSTKIAARYERDIL
ncbi:MAG: pilus assembly protein [Actinobacteria bacterium]|nr:pilus assembly protein [Actinomycetota bacterium]